MPTTTDTSGPGEAHRRTRNGRRSLSLFALATAAALVVAQFASAPSANAKSFKYPTQKAVTAVHAVGGKTVPVATLKVTAPKTVRVGDDVILRIDGAHLAGAAGYEVGLTYAPGTFTLGGAKSMSRRLSKAGGALVAVSPVERTNGVSFAAWSCTSGPCLAGAVPPVSTGSQLLLVDLVAHKVGKVQLRMDTVTLVGAAGQRLPLDVAATTTTVAVSTAAGKPVATMLRAPHLAASTRTLHRAAWPALSDLTGDRQVTIQDVHEVELAWTAAVSANGECLVKGHGRYGPPDANADGCLDVADMQAFGHGIQREPAGTVVQEGDVSGDTGTSLTTRSLGAMAADTGTAIVLTVNSAGDQDDIATDGLCKTSVNTCTLRAAITESKRQSTQPVIINFAIPGTGVHTISPATRLPSLTNPMGVTIDGYTQPGASVNTSPHADNAVIDIAIVGQGVNGVDGFLITSTNNVLRGLSIDEFHHNVWLYGSSAGNNRVVGCFVGTDPTGTHAAQFLQIGASGINMQGGAYGNVIGTPALADRNVVSGNYQNGIATYDNTTTNNTIQNNIVGLNPAGTARLANQTHGVDINTWTTNTLIGGSEPGQGNVASGNLGEGIEISHGPGTLGNDIVGNLIGTEVTGASAPTYAQNRQWGVRLEGAQTCDPCPPDAGNSVVADNVIVNNLDGGLLTDKGFHDSEIRDNFIGLLANGTPAKNTLWGIRIAHGATHFLVTGNTIAYNDNGIQVDGLGVSPNDATSQPTNDETISKNSIYSNGDGLGIDLTPLGAVNKSSNADPTINDGMLAPTISSTTAGAVQGTTCAGCTVEAFQADRPAGQVGSGKRFISSSTADSTGHFVNGLDAAVQGNVVTVDSTDSAGSTSEFSLNVAVPLSRPSNVNPVATFTSSCTHLTCSFDGSGSRDSDGTVVNWAWSYGDGTTDQGVKTTHVFAHRGTYTVSLTVVDNDGGTDVFTAPVTVVNNSPTAVFVSNCVYLSCSFDGSGSKDSDGVVSSYAWTFGDGSTGTGPTPSHTYPAAGTFTVGLTVVDNDGDSGSTTGTVVVSDPPPGASATDTFTRTVTPGWKNADLGGTYTYPSGSSGLSTDGSTGLMSIPSPGSTRSAYLPNIHDRDVDLKISVGTDRVPTGFGESSYLVSRNVGTNVSYRSRLRFASNNGVYLTAMKVTGGSEVAIGAEVQVPGLSWSSGARFNFRTTVTGVNPTTISLKAWPVGGTEPGWQVTRTDSEPVLQAAGSDAVMSYLSPSATNAPIVFRYDDLLFAATTSG